MYIKNVCMEQHPASICISERVLTQRGHEHVNIFTENIKPCETQPYWPWRLVAVSSPVLPEWAPPTLPSVPIGVLKLRVHLASSSESVELSPRMASKDSRNMPALVWKVQRGKKSTSCAKKVTNTLI